MSNDFEVRNFYVIVANLIIIVLVIDTHFSIHKSLVNKSLKDF
jgi:hypothetical protein